MRLVENSKVVIKDAIGTSPLQTATNGVDMSKYARCKITLIVACSDAAVVAGTVTLKQGTSTTCSTALTMVEYWKNEDLLAGDTLTKVTASSLATAGIQNKTAMYVFEIKADQLDTDTLGSENTHIRLDQAAITTATGTHTLIYELYEPRYAMGGEATPTAFA